MIYLDELRLHNFVVFKQLSWQLDKYPLTVIRGLNLDRGNSANAVGKSLLAASIANLITDAPPIRVRKHSARELVFGKGRIELTMRNDKTAWSLRQFAKGKSVNYDIYRNNKHLTEKKDVRQARKLIHQAFPLSEEQFYSTVFLNSYRPPILLYGSATARLNFFEEIFDLRIYDMMRGALLQDLRKINNKFAQAEILHKQQNELQPQIKQDLSAIIEKTRQRHKHLLQQYRAANEQAQQLIAYTTLAEQLHGEATHTALHRQSKIIGKKLRQTNRRYNRMQRRRGAARNNQRILRTRNKLQQQLQDLVKPKQSYIELTKFIRRVEDRIEQMQRNIQIYLDYQKYIEKYREIVAFINLRAKLDPKGLQRQLTEQQHSLAQFKSLRSGKPCPVCGHKVDRRHHRHTINLLTENIKLVNEQLRRAKRVAFCRKLQAKVPRHVLYDLSIKPAQRTLTKLTERYAQMQKQAKRWEQRRELIKQLRQLPKIRTMRTVDRHKLRYLARRINRLTQQQERITNDLQLLDKIAALDLNYDSLAEAKLALRQIQIIVDKISPRMQTVSDRMHRFTAQQAEYTAASRQLRDINNELAEIEAIINNRDIVEALVAAYSTKGIRLLQVQALANAYTNGLNTLASSIYAEPMKFHCDVSPLQFNILAERHHKIGDVRSLSGSESRQFMCISAPAIIKLLPNHLRCSHIFLDEMENGLSRPDRQLFTQQFIPILANSVPNVVVITPYSEEELQIINAKELLLVREHGVTKWG